MFVLFVPCIAIQFSSVNNKIHAFKINVLIQCLVSSTCFEHRVFIMRYGWKGLWSWSLSLCLCGSSLKGTWRQGSLAGDPEGYVEKALEMGISFHRGPVWGNLEEGSSTRDFERWMKGALGVECLSLKRLRGGGLGGNSFTGDPGKYVKKVSWYGGPFPAEGNLVCGGGAHVLGTLIDERRRAVVVGHLSARVSMKGTLGEGSFTGEPKRWGFWEICKMPCKRASLFIGALLGNLEGVHWLGLLREKKSISGFLSWTWRPLGF